MAARFQQVPIAVLESISTTPGLMDGPPGWKFRYRMAGDNFQLLVVAETTRMAKPRSLSDAPC